MNDPRASATMTHERAGVLMAGLPARIELGLSDAEIEAVEQRYGFRFAPDHRVLLEAGLPVGRQWPDWRNGDPAELREYLDQPRVGVLAAVQDGYWHRGWGLRPEALAEALAFADARLREAPQLVPVFAHRYLPGIAGQAGLPVFSVHGVDIICYGTDLSDYLHYEFGAAVEDGSPARLRVPFWSSFLVAPAFTAKDLVHTPVDAYATEPESAVEHLRMLAVEQRLHRRVGDDQRIQAALTAVALGVESPSLERLAGLTRRESRESAELFLRVVAELDLRIPADEAEARWALVRWWLRLIADGSLGAYHGGVLVWLEGWDRLGHPTALQPLIGWTSEYEDWTESYPMPRGRYKELIVEEAQALLAGPWPPPGRGPAGS